MNENPGTFILNPAVPSKHVSVVAAGLGRSGTTMVSRVLSALGLFMGDELTPGTNEDKDFQNAIKARSLTEFERLCRDRDGRFDRWGFKCPAARHDLAGLIGVMRAPRAIITSREPLAMAMRTASATEADVLPTLREGLRRMMGLLETVAGLDCPVLLLSYEKALTRPRECVTTIATFCGISGDETQLEQAAGVIRNGDPAYLSTAA